MRRLALILSFLLVFIASADAAVDKAAPASTDASVRDFMQKEELPLGHPEVGIETKSPTRHVGKIAVGVAILLILAGATAFGLKALKTQSVRQGSRKYLIEKMSYANLGPKSGVCLLKVGKEFVLVGVTPQQINFLSTLPELTKEYNTENKGESDSFREAVQEEFKRIKGKPPLNI